jgi:hypothetical protein
LPRQLPQNRVQRPGTQFCCSTGSLGHRRQFHAIGHRASYLAVLCCVLQHYREDAETLRGVTRSVACAELRFVSRAWLHHAVCSAVLWAVPGQCLGTSG